MAEPSKNTSDMAGQSEKKSVSITFEDKSLQLHATTEELETFIESLQEQEDRAAKRRSSKATRSYTDQHSTAKNAVESYEERLDKAFRHLHLQEGLGNSTNNVDGVGEYSSLDAIGSYVKIGNSFRQLQRCLAERERLSAPSDGRDDSDGVKTTGMRRYEEGLGKKLRDLQERIAKVEVGKGDATANAKETIGPDAADKPKSPSATFTDTSPPSPTSVADMFDAMDHL